MRNRKRRKKLKRRRMPRRRKMLPKLRPRKRKKKKASKKKKRKMKNRHKLIRLKKSLLLRKKKKPLKKKRRRNPKNLNPKKNPKIKSKQLFKCLTQVSRRLISLKVNSIKLSKKQMRQQSWLEVINQNSLSKFSSIFKN